ncbi:MAG TPA: ATP-dependent DNA helicase [Streptosporangiaceae bacterium]|jgi:ATP-dependent DNA helicase DinG|nr:ATP-dependent DNA helicase [Streptosporangiaceae bacterium]
MPPSSVAADAAELLSAAVRAIGGAERTGQVTMARAVQQAIESGEHLAVQAGTGTGKSLAYLVPAARHAIEQQATVVVSTATIALQRQLIDRDLPRLAAAIKPILHREPVFAILKGRRNYLCLQRLRGGPADDGEQVLFDPAAVSAIGRQVQRLHEWAADTKTGDRDELVPGVGEQAWRQVSVSARECVGVQRCVFGSQCFAELAREEAGKADIVVTNHALLAIDALEDYEIFPEHDVVIIDEAHDLTDRVTSVATDELSVPAIDVAARRCGKMIDEKLVARLRDAAAAAEPVFAETQAGRIDVLDEVLAITLTSIRDAAAACATDFRTSGKSADDEPDRAVAKRAALAALGDVEDAAARILGAYGAGIADRTDVVWMDRPGFDEAGRPPTLRVAPLGVGGLLASRLFSRRTVVLTSATLTLGGSFEPLARQWGLEGLAGSAEEPDAEALGELPEPHSLAWTGIDVGSPFDHPRSAILYVAKHLPPPGRDGLDSSYLDELAELIEAAGGRTLGLFSSMRAARQATDELRGRLAYPLLCQGDDQTAQLVTQFAADEATCLFGTLSLWQGVDVPGSSLQLVVIDRIPFPRPDDPLASARQRAVAAHGGNGFMSVSATQAALLLAQGTGRLLRTMTDRGVVAVLDPRLSTARYSGFLRASLPPYWTTTDPEVVRGALRRLAAAASVSAGAEAGKAGPAQDDDQGGES